MAGIIGLLVVAVAAAVLFVPHGSSSARGGSSAGITPAAVPSGPSGSPIVPAAAAIITNVQTASAVDGSYHPTQVVSSVPAGKTLYITFDLHLNGKTGYVLAKFYRDRAFLDKTQLTVDQPALNGAVYGIFSNPISNGDAELYWCERADCGGAQLAAVAHFTITPITTTSAATGPMLALRSWGSGPGYTL